MSHPTVNRQRVQHLPLVAREGEPLLDLLLTQHQLGPHPHTALHCPPPQRGHRSPQTFVVATFGAWFLVGEVTRAVGLVRPVAAPHALGSLRSAEEGPAAHAGEGAVVVSHPVLQLEADPAPAVSSLHPGHAASRAATNICLHYTKPVLCNNIKQRYITVMK